jgi:hypothetical protein
MVATCIPITEEKVRAEVYLGAQLLAKTPFVLNFTVNKSRTQLSTTASVTLELLAGTSFPLGEQLKIKAGLRGSLKDIFAGEINTTRVDPSFGKPSYYKLTMTASGVLSKLEGKKFSRRLRSDGQGMFCLITGAGGPRPDAYYSLDAPKKAGNGERIATTPDPSRYGSGEQSGLVIYNRGQGTAGAGGTAIDYARQPAATSTGNAGSGDFKVHDHSDLDNGGPAWGVYSAD